jgi:hypothetical protein
MPSRERADQTPTPRAENKGRAIASKGFVEANPVERLPEGRRPRTTQISTRSRAVLCARGEPHVRHVPLADRATDMQEHEKVTAVSIRVKWGPARLPDLALHLSCNLVAKESRLPLACHTVRLRGVPAIAWS